MTTNVEVTAWCTSNKEVIVRRSDSITITEKILQNGEKCIYSVYDGWTISVKEVLKENA